MHAIPDSQRRAVERVAGVLFPDVPKFATGREAPSKVNRSLSEYLGQTIGEPGRTRTSNPLIKSQLLYH